MPGFGGTVSSAIDKMICIFALPNKLSQNIYTTDHKIVDLQSGIQLYTGGINKHPFKDATNIETRGCCIKQKSITIIIIIY